MMNPASSDPHCSKQSRDRALVIDHLIEKCKITPKLLNYVENFTYPYVNDVSSYESIYKIGQGTFGEVFKARCKRTGRFVALKKILMENEKEGFPITALREIKMLQKLKHENITELIEICTSKSSKSTKFSFYLVFTFCEHDLAGLLSNRARVKPSLAHKKTMMQHILRGLWKIHSSNILHRDMKAANVLITKDGLLKLADFGLARLMLKQPGYCYTNRVVTLWYRPPELLLGSRNYGPAIDIWGAGCIMAELWTRTPIMQGETEQSQLKLITYLCGSITPESWPGCQELPYFGKLELPVGYTRTIHEKMGNHMMQCGQALSLLDRMLALNPADRPDASDALDHEYFFEQPLPQPNIIELVDQIKNMNMFEYTTNSGAHAHRKRPLVPQASEPVPKKQPNLQAPTISTLPPKALQQPPIITAGPSRAPQPPAIPTATSKTLQQPVITAGPSRTSQPNVISATRSDSKTFHASTISAGPSKNLQQPLISAATSKASSFNSGQSKVIQATNVSRSTMQQSTKSSTVGPTKSLQPSHHLPPKTLHPPNRPPNKVSQQPPNSGPQTQKSLQPPPNNQKIATTNTKNSLSC